MSAAELQAERVCCWIKGDPKEKGLRGEFIGLCKIVDGAEREGRHLTRSTAYAEAERAGISISDGDGTPAEDDITRNHNFWPCVTRYMAMLRPKRARVIEYRRSKFDRVDLARIWHENVNARTFFLAVSREAAQDLCGIGDASAS